GLLSVLESLETSSTPGSVLVVIVQHDAVGFQELPIDPSSARFVSRSLHSKYAVIPMIPIKSQAEESGGVAAGRREIFAGESRREVDRAARARPPTCITRSRAAPAAVGNRSAGGTPSRWCAIRDRGRPTCP